MRLCKLGCREGWGEGEGINKQTNKQTDKRIKTNKRTNNLTNEQVNKLTSKQTSKQANKQTEIHTRERSCIWFALTHAAFLSPQQQHVCTTAQTPCQHQPELSWRHRLIERALSSCSTWSQDQAKGARGLWASASECTEAKCACCSAARTALPGVCQRYIIFSNLHFKGNRCL